MKSKIIYLVHLTGRIESLASVEKIFYNIVDELKSEGRVLKSLTFNTAKFEDGTAVYKIPLGSKEPYRFTHLYVDEKILELPSGQEYIESLKSSMIDRKSLTNFDTEGSIDERISVFGRYGIKKLKGE